MSFDSATYFIFLGIFLVAYWQASHRQQNILLVVASYIFYGWWDWRFLSLIIASTTVDYYLSQKIAQAVSLEQRKKYLVVSISLNILVLAVFKYFHFFTDNLFILLRHLGLPLQPLTLHIILPIGISFYTFEAIAYMVSVYQAEMAPARSFLDYALFIAFFPHLLCGPIMRPKQFIPQIMGKRHLTRRQLVSGLDLLFWGLVKKLFIADGVAYYVDRIFSLSNPSLVLVLVASIGFGIQILADFSGYTDIARGSARLLGFELSHNFYRPYASRSITEFWRRWHVSLSRWIRDYIYIPLGGSRGSKSRYALTILVTWFLCGLWHGAAWTFVVWGLYHGAWIFLEKTNAHLFQGARWWRVTRTYLLVHGGWLIFRAPSLAQLRSYFTADAFLLSLQDFRTSYVILCIFAFYAFPWCIKGAWDHYRAGMQFSRLERLETRLVSYSWSLVLILLFGKIYTHAFIYFQF